MWIWMWICVFAQCVLYEDTICASACQWWHCTGKTLSAADKLIPACLQALESIGEYYYYCHYTRQQWDCRLQHDEGLPVCIAKTKRGTTCKKDYWLLPPVNRIRTTVRMCLQPRWGSAASWARATRKEREKEEEKEGAQAQAHCRHQLASLACQPANLLQYVCMCVCVCCWRGWRIIIFAS